MDESIIKKTDKKNKETIDKYNKEFFLKNKDKKYLCECCNFEVSFFNKSHHRNSLKHKYNILLIENEKLKKLIGNFTNTSE